MKISVSNQPAAEVTADAIAIPVSEGPDRHTPELGAATEAVRNVIRGREHAGALGEVLPVHVSSGSAPRFLLYGVGSPADLDGFRLRNAHQFLVRSARKLGYRKLGLLPSGDILRSETAAKAAVEGCVLGAWERRSRVTGEPERGVLEELVLVNLPLDAEAVAAAQELADATNAARELQNMPANELTPSVLAHRAEEIAAARGLEVEVLGRAELEERQYRLLLGVASGSAEEPRLILLRHRGGDAGGRTLALVGKGITFDSGGISIKPAAGMHRMKADMAGAAAVLCAMEVIAQRRVAADVIGVIAATENMPGGRALRPGDVIKSAAGPSVEVVNTDAEGRLVLGDALTHAIAAGATHIVDLATLTGAATVALGHTVTAVVANDDAHCEMVFQAADRAGERLGRLPMNADYRHLLRSRIADIRNSDYGEAGTIMGALFIHEFAQERPWAHLDIAATSWNSNDELTTVPLGPSGVGTRTLVHLAELFAGAAR